MHAHIAYRPPPTTRSRWCTRFSSRDARGANLMEPFERIMVAFQPADAFLDGQAGLHRLRQRTDAGQRRQVAVGFVNAHKLCVCGFNLTSDPQNSTAISRMRRELLPHSSFVSLGVHGWLKKTKRREQKFAPLDSSLGLLWLRPTHRNRGRTRRGEDATGSRRLPCAWH